jgi:hypothetical protein
MAIIESTATALVRFTGLGLVVFNQDKKRGEIGIIRDGKHELSIKIQAPRFVDGSEKDILMYEDIATFKNLQGKNVSISISTKGSSAANGFEIYQSAGEFNRLESEDLNDYRWIVDMSQLHGEDLVKTKNLNRFPISKLYIENGLFYVHKLNTEMFFNKIEKDENGNAISNELFGNIGETVGVKLESAEVTVKISVDGEETSHTFARVENLPYRIEIMNMNYEEDAPKSDMPDYYLYQSSQSGKTFELEPVKEENAIGDSVTMGVFCHPVGGGNGGITSIDDLD